MEFGDKNKIDILITLLNERYNVSHKIRERSLKFALWILGFAVAFIWILINGKFFTIGQKIILSLLVIVFGLISYWFLKSLEQGFNKNREVMIDIEKALGCYEEGFYVKSETLYPDTYKRKRGMSEFSHFKSIYYLILPVAILLICLIWASPCDKDKKTKDAQKTEKAEIINWERTVCFRSKSQSRGEHG